MCEPVQVCPACQFVIRIFSGLYAGTPGDYPGVPTQQHNNKKKEIY